jgi:hypothetical protein
VVTQLTRFGMTRTAVLASETLQRFACSQLDALIRAISLRRSEPPRDAPSKRRWTSHAWQLAFVRPTDHPKDVAVMPSITATVDGEISPCAKIVALDNKNLLAKLGDGRAFQSGA